MGLIKYLKNKLTNDMNKKIHAKIGDRWSDPPIKNAIGWQELYNKNPRMNPVTKISNTLSCTPILFEMNDGEIIENEITNFLNNPNPNISSTTLKFLTQAWLDVVGECGWLIEKDIKGKPMEAYPIPPHWIYSTPTENKPYFEIFLSEDVSILYTVQIEDFIYFKSPMLINPYGRGIGNVQQIGDEIETDEYMAKYSKRLFYNDATPSLLIMADGATDTQKERLRTEWLSKYQGGINAYEPAFFSSNLQIQVLKQSMLELDFIESRRYTRDASIEHFGIPKELFGIVDNSNRSTIEVAEYIYIKYVMLPRFKSITDILNRDLLPMFGSRNGKLKFEDTLPQNNEFILQKANDGYDKGALTLNEWRMENGYEKLPGNQGEVRKTALNVIEEPVYMDDNLQSKEEIESDEPITIIDDTTQSEEVKILKKKIKMVD